MIIIILALSAWLISTLLTFFIGFIDGLMLVSKNPHLFYDQDRLGDLIMGHVSAWPLPLKIVTYPGQLTLDFLGEYI